MNKISSSIRREAQSFSFGAQAIDSRLPQGITRGALHEIYSDDCDGIVAIGFAILLALRSAPAKPIVLVRDERSVGAFGRLYGDGIVDLGGDPEKFVIIHTADALATLRSGADAVDCSEVGTVVVEPWQASPLFDLTASRRIALRAAKSGVLTLVVRIGTAPVPSTAATRWHVKSAQSAPFLAAAPGHSTFDIKLLRHRGGICGLDARVEWDRDQRSFRDAPNPRAVPAVAIGRTRNTRIRRAG